MKEIRAKKVPKGFVEFIREAINVGSLSLSIYKKDCDKSLRVRGSSQEVNWIKFNFLGTIAKYSSNAYQCSLEIC